MAATEALYWKAPTEAELAGSGLKPKHYKAPDVEVWDDDGWDAIQLFMRHSTQWRMSMAGPVGLDYTVILHDLARCQLTDEEHETLMDRLSIIERAALEILHRK